MSNKNVTETTAVGNDVSKAAEAVIATEVAKSVTPVEVSPVDGEINVFTIKELQALKSDESFDTFFDNGCMVRLDLEKAKGKASLVKASLYAMPDAAAQAPVEPTEAQIAEQVILDDYRLNSHPKAKTIVIGWADFRVGLMLFRDFEYRKSQYGENATYLEKRSIKGRDGKNIDTVIFPGSILRPLMAKIKVAHAAAILVTPIVPAATPAVQAPATQPAGQQTLPGITVDPLADLKSSAKQISDGLFGTATHVLFSPVTATKIMKLRTVIIKDYQFMQQSTAPEKTTKGAMLARRGQKVIYVCQRIDTKKNFDQGNTKSVGLIVDGTFLNWEQVNALPV